MASTSQGVAAPDPQGQLESKDLPNVRPLGKGLSGIIYETTWSGKRYARKDFPLGSMKHNLVFEKEAKSLFNLDHPNIVKCFGYTIGKSSCSLLQEYVDDNLQTTMEKRIEAQRKSASSGSASQSTVLDVEEIKRLVSSKAEEIEGGDVPAVPPFELREAVDIILQIATGMEYLHDHGIAHGDLKPSNVMVHWEESAGAMKVKVADFGLIETKKRIKLVAKRARHFEILMWKAPERLEKLLGPLTKSSDDPFTESDTNSDESQGYENFKKSKLAMADVYSFGLMCLHVLGEGLMYPDLSLTQIREERTVTEPTRPKLPSSCPEYLELLIHSILEFEFSRRPTFFYIRTVLETFQPKYISHLLEGIISKLFLCLYNIVHILLGELCFSKTIFIF